MKNTSIIFILLTFILLPLHVLAEGYAIFPLENVSDLTIIALDADTSSFVVQTKNGENVTGYIGDYLGHEEAKVVEVKNKFITLETNELVVDKDGIQHEQLSRMKIPLSFAKYGHGKVNR